MISWVFVIMITSVISRKNPLRQETICDRDRRSLNPPQKAAEGVAVSF